MDVCNLCSLEDQIPLGLYDRDQVHGSVMARVGREGEGYQGIRKQRVSLSGRLLLADEDGPFRAPTSDSLRTAVQTKSRNLLVVLFCPVERAGSDCDDLARADRRPSHALHLGERDRREGRALTVWIDLLRSEP